MVAGTEIDTAALSVDVNGQPAPGDRDVSGTGAPGGGQGGLRRGARPQVGQQQPSGTRPGRVLSRASSTSSGLGPVSPV